MNVKKKISESLTEQVQIVYPEHTNGLGRLFGGRLTEWIDTVGAVAARRHAGAEVITACIDRLEFKASAPLSSTVVMIAKLLFAGRTSMEVQVKSFVERLEDGKRELINLAYVVYVALGPDGTPAEVPEAVPETQEEKTDYEAAKARYKARKKGI